MPRTTLLRTKFFRATHRYWRAEWSEDRNLEVFGEQTLPHSHRYRVEVSLDGEVDRETGFLVDLPALDVLLGEVLGDLDARDLNQAIPQVRDGSMLPSTEALAGWLWSRLEGRIPGRARLRRVRVAESDELASEVTCDGEGP